MIVGNTCMYFLERKVATHNQSITRPSDEYLYTIFPEFSDTLIIQGRHVESPLNVNKQQKASHKTSRQLVKYSKVD